MIRRLGKRSGRGGLVHVVAIDHPEGVNLYPCASESVAKSVVAEWARTYWDHWFDEGEPAPLDDDEVVNQFFEKAAEEESYVIDERPLIRRRR